MARVRPATVCWRESAIEPGFGGCLQRGRVDADCTARGRVGSVRGEVLLSIALAQIGKPSIFSSSEETTRERGRGILDLYIYIYMCTKNLAGRCDFEAAFVESRIQGLQILPAR